MLGCAGIDEVGLVAVGDSRTTLISCAWACDCNCDCEGAIVDFGAASGCEDLNDENEPAPYVVGSICLARALDTCCEILCFCFSSLSGNADRP